MAAICRVSHVGIAESHYSLWAFKLVSVAMLVQVGRLSRIGYLEIVVGPFIFIIIGSLDVDHTWEVYLQHSEGDIPPITVESKFDQIHFSHPYVADY